MANDAPLAKRLSIREAGHDEYWLQDKIVAEPSCLNLGDLEVVQKERKQASGGRLDILLKDPEDDAMYEVEVMLGETNESHIIRTIEYWDNERRKWPKRQHIAVIIAEEFDNRFYKVILLLSHALPLIAIQANLVDTTCGPHLVFTKVLDTYEEPEEIVESRGPSDEAYWREKASWTLESAKKLFEQIGPSLPKSAINYVQEYIAITVDGDNYMWLNRRREDKSLLEFRVKEQFHDEMNKLLDENKISFSRRSQYFHFTVDKQWIGSSQAILQKIANIVQKSVNA